MVTELSGERKKVAIVVTSVLIVKFFLVPHLKALSKIYDVTLLLKNDEPEIFANLDLPVRILTIPIERKISLWQDFRALACLFNIFRRERFDLVHSLSPKGGLLGMVAAWAARVPVRVHTFQGEVWASRQGVWRQILRSIDKLVARLATSLTVVAESERRFLINQGVIDGRKATVLSRGSIGGVDLERFHSAPGARISVRNSLGLAADDVLFIYVGRLNRDKGLLELGQAFLRLAQERADVHLLFVGPDEEDLRQRLLSDLGGLGGRATFLPYTSRPEDFMAAADILVLPSYREGFPVSIIEAAAMGVPAIGSNIYGISDAIQDKVTGLLFEKGDAADLYEKMKCMATMPLLRSELGRNGLRRVEEHFVQQVVINAFLNYYAEILANA